MEEQKEDWVDTLELHVEKKRTADLSAQLAKAKREVEEAAAKLARVRRGKRRISEEGSGAPSNYNMEAPSKICGQL